MTTLRSITMGLLLSLLGAHAAFAQADTAGKPHAPDDANVTISISAGGVRFAAPGGVGQVRLEVFDANGASVYNSEFQPGNVRDWTLQDERGQTLPDGSYLCVVTVKGSSKRMSVRQGTVVIQGGQASLQLGEGDVVGAVEAEKSPAQGGGGEVTPLAAGTGTQNRLAKWSETGGAGTLTDSAVTEIGGLTVFGASEPLFPSLPNFHVVDIVSAGTKTPLTLIGGSGSMEFWKDTSASRAVSFGMAVPGAGTSDDMVFGAWNGSNWSEKMRLTNGGNVGIGTNNPLAKLDVGGDLMVSGNAVVAGNIAAKYQDVAEWVPARQKIAAGTVVVLDSTRSNGVMPSERRYDTHVAGVVSAQPGVILGQGGKGQVLVATTGRVRVKVDATMHAIKIGDLLVSSDTPGLAMMSQPIRVAGNRIHRPGTIIGKALEPLAGGKGEIMVLLSLQ